MSESTYTGKECQYNIVSLLFLKTMQKYTFTSTVVPGIDKQIPGRFWILLSLFNPLVAHRFARVIVFLSRPHLRWLVGVWQKILLNTSPKESIISERYTLSCNRLFFYIKPFVFLKYKALFFCWISRLLNLSCLHFILDSSMHHVISTFKQKG